jgi:CheY-like chemotaxis protein
MPQVTTLPLDSDLLSAEPDLLYERAREPRRGAILVVEDRDDVRQGLAQLLELHGYVVFDAADGAAAEAQWTVSPDIALILLDLLLPGPVSGHELRARQLANPRLAEIPTIIISSCEPDLSGRAQLRPAAWLEKPFRFDKLLALVKQYVLPETGGILLAD